MVEVVPAGISVDVTTATGTGVGATVMTGGAVVVVRTTFVVLTLDGFNEVDVDEPAKVVDVTGAAGAAVDAAPPADTVASPGITGSVDGGTSVVVVVVVVLVVVVDVVVVVVVVVDDGSGAPETRGGPMSSKCMPSGMLHVPPHAKPLRRNT